jgi:hypothetical protein
VAKVAWLADGVVAGKKLASPFAFLLDAAVLPDGSSHTLLAVATAANSGSVLRAELYVDGVLVGQSARALHNALGCRQGRTRAA